MDQQSEIAVVGLVGALLGSIIGGLISYLTSRSLHTLEWRHSTIDKKIRSREKLYAQFLSECNLISLRIIDKKFSESTELAKLLALESKIWFYSDDVGASARKLVVSIFDLPDKKKDGPIFANLRDEFIKICKADLAALY